MKYYSQKALEEYFGNIGINGHLLIDDLSAGKVPNIDIPEPHGRLGDLDAIRETIEYSAFWDDSDHNLARDIIKFAPTILEATE